MTNREFELLSYMRQHPLASQDELAEVFCVARSTISVHISNLLAKGYILGRGYIFNEDYVVCAGVSNVDISAFASEPLVRHGKNPNTRVKINAGGVARNICEDLARQGVHAKMLSCVGGDSNGKYLIRASKEAGIDMDEVQVVKDARSCTYISLHQPDGDMEIGATDMRLAERLDCAYFRSKQELIRRARFMVLSPDLPEDSLAYLLSNFPDTPAFIDVVSAEYTQKLRPFLSHIHTLKANEYEIEALTGIAPKGDKELEQCARWVLDQGVKEVFITMGGRGAYACNQQGQKVRAAAPVVRAVQSTAGAGDAFSSGIIYASLQQFPLSRKVAYAQNAAAFTLQCSGAIHPELSVQTILNFGGNTL